VFVASIVVPILKILALGVLAITAQKRSDWGQLQRARLYRLLEAVGHWSMLDIFVVALLVTLVQFGNLAQTQPEPGIIAFGAVVVLTMLASAGFDPRLIWDDTNG
jgi:paraquat-inducible protein A